MNLMKKNMKKMDILLLNSDIISSVPYAGTEKR